MKDDLYSFANPTLSISKCRIENISSRGVIEKADSTKIEPVIVK